MGVVQTPRLAWLAPSTGPARVKGQNVKHYLGTLEGCFAYDFLSSKKKNTAKNYRIKKALTLYFFEPNTFY